MPFLGQGLQLFHFVLQLHCNLPLGAAVASFDGLGFVYIS